MTYAYTLRTAQDLRVNRHLLAGILALAFAALFLFIPWDVIRGVQFTDIPAYIERLERIELVGYPISIGRGDLLTILIDEPVWNLIGLAIVNLHIPFDVGLRAIGAASAGVAFYYAASRGGTIFATLVLANPISFDLYSSNVRSAFAAAILCCALMLVRKSPALAVSAVVIAALTHTSSILLVGLWVVALAVHRFIPSQSRMIALAIGCVIALAMVYALPTLLELVGDRRVLGEYAVKSHAYLAFWGLLAVILTFAPKAHRGVSVESLFVIIAFAAAVTCELLGLTMFRIIALTLPALAVAAAGIGRIGTLTVGAAVILYYPLLWWYWLRFATAWPG